jgi:hypothetical protein
MNNYPLPSLPPEGKESIISPLGETGKGVDSKTENKNKPTQSSFRKYSLIKSSSLGLLLILILTEASGQSLNYREIFGEDWIKAETFERENRSWMEPVLAKNHIFYPLAISVIFPELVRYSALRDKMEITLLKTLYINLGEYYANFSVGQFQMKPSFAEQIRNQAPSFLQRRSGITFKTSKEYDNILDFRRSIVKDLEDPKIQMNYLISFIKICEKNYRTKRKDEYSIVRFLATAYNFGFDKSAETIESMTDKNFFNIKLFKTQNYSYSDVSLFWYKEYMSQKK